MQNTKIYTVIVAEDEKLLLNSLVKKINNCGLGFEVIGTAENGLDAYKMIEELCPHVVFSDIEMPLLSGLDLFKLISDKYPHIKKVILSGYSDFTYAQKAIKLDVQEYLLKPIKSDDLAKTMATLRIALDKEHNLLNDSIFDLKKESNYTARQIAELVEQYIIEQYSQEINFDLIAQHFGFNTIYLSRIFTKYIGENPSTYLITLRINKAKYLLKNEPLLSVKEIGEIVGYHDQFYFSRIFKKYTNTSPSNYRDMHIS